MRIVSLVPSLTELIFDLGLENELVGRTKFCIHPSNKVKSITKIGGTKNVNTKTVLSLKPDLIIANKEENSREDIEILMHQNEVLITDITNYDSAIEAIKSIGQITKKIDTSLAMVDKVEQNFSKISKFSTGHNKVCYLIWNNPVMSIGKDTFIHSMLNKCGFENIFHDINRYPSLEIEEIQKKDPNFIFLSSEPFPFKAKHISNYQNLFPNAKVVLVDGEYFSWYGSRMVKAPNYFNSLIESVRVD